MAQVLTAERTEVHGLTAVVDRRVPPPGTLGERPEFRATPFRNRVLVESGLFYFMEGFLCCLDAGEEVVDGGY